jgi:alpha-mannosidase
MTEREAELAKALGIPDDATIVLILEQSAHCDWDWMTTFQNYFALGYKSSSPVESIIKSAVGYIHDYAKMPMKYTYVFCEVAYLQAYVSQASDIEVAALKAAVTKSWFRFSSGGITSAENLIGHGEAFIRNYLIGRQWLNDTFNATASLQMWIPDDFGHDAQLPVVLQAMGYMGAGFERIPYQWGEPGGVPFCVKVTDAALSNELLTKVGLDFTWCAADGSSIQAHWLVNLYGEGNTQFGGSTTIPWADASTDLGELIAQNRAYKSKAFPQHTRYLFVPIDQDFSEPYANLPHIVYCWNQVRGWNSGEPCQPPPSGSTEYPTSYAMMGTFDDYMQLVQAATSGSTRLPMLLSNPQPNGNGTPFAMVPNPVYSGCYGSRMTIKQLHYQTARALLQAESLQLVMQYLASQNPDQWSGIAQLTQYQIASAWAALMPSTHHDYVPGTAPDDVTTDEQINNLQTIAWPAASNALADVMKSIAGAVTTGSSTPAVALFNGVGFAREGVAWLSFATADLVKSVTTDFVNYTPVQVIGSGGSLLLMTGVVPAMGWSLAFLTVEAPTVTPTLSAIENGDGSWTLANEYLSATITTAGITELYDLQGSDPSQNLIAGIGNALVFYYDTGNIYRFGMEIPCNGNEFYADSSLQMEKPVLTLIEGGPLRVSLSVTGTVSGSPYTVTYQLVAGQNALQITVQGTAPSNYSVMARFPFGSAIQSLNYGTTYHWDNRAPRYFSSSPSTSTFEVMTFEPTHEFVVPLDASSSPLAAIYHYATPGWAIDNSGALLGCLFRNTPNGGNGANGSDTDNHTVSYALRVPSGLQSPIQAAWGAGAPLGEAMAVNNPIQAVEVPDVPSDELPATLSIASTIDPRALVTAVKQGTVNGAQMIVRLYQPTNGSADAIDVTIDPGIASMYQYDGSVFASAVTALETPSLQDLNLTNGPSGFACNLPYALTTVALGQ